MPKDKSDTKKSGKDEKNNNSKSKTDPQREALLKRIHTLQNIADPSGLKEAIRVLDLCNVDPLMLRIMEEKIQGWENDVVEALPPEEREKFTKESKKALRGSDDDETEGGGTNDDDESRSRRSRGGATDSQLSPSGSRHEDDGESQYTDDRSRHGGGGGGGRGRRDSYGDSQSRYTGDSQSRGAGGSRYSDQYGTEEGDSQYGGGGGKRRGFDSESRYSEGSSQFYQPRRGGGGGGRGYRDDDYDDYDDRRGRGRRSNSMYSDATGDSFYDDRRRGGGGRNSNRRNDNRGSRTRDMPPPGANEFRPVDRHLYENARQRLIDFYSMVNPEKVKDVDKILEAYNGEEETLFRQLHLKYVSNLRKRLDPEQKAHEEELLDRAKKLGTNLPPPPPPEDVKLEGLSVNDLLTRGSQLMNSAPEPPIVNRGNNNNNQIQQIPVISNDSEVVPALEQLHVLTESNLSLAQEVAIAEQSVLQSRFRVILSKCLKSFNNSPNHLLVINDMHAGIEFQVALSDAVWSFLKEAVLDTPLIHSNSVRVTVSASHAGGTTTQVDRNILASALREWSAQSPHTVAQRKAGGRWSFSTSRTAWWIWPSAPAMRDAVPGKSLVYPTVHREPHRATNLNDASFPSLRDLISARATHYSSPSGTRQNKDGTITSPNAALYDPTRQNPGYWDHFAHQMGVLQSTPELNGVKF